MASTSIASQLWAVGDRVNLEYGGWATVIGHVVGERASERCDQPSLWYVVELDHGFWSEGRTAFVSLLVVHGDSIEFREQRDQ